MDTLADLIQAVQDDLTVGDESTLYPPSLITRAINRAYRKCASVFDWPVLQDALKTTTQANVDYYDYPSNWRSNSIWKLRVNYERYGEEPDGSPLSFDDYLNWKEDYPDSTDKKWANQQRRYFISPAPTVAGLIICIWGKKVITTLVNDSDETIFSGHMQEGNEAVVLEAVAILKSKGEQEKQGEFRSIEAKNMLVVAWNEIGRSKGKYEKNMPMFNVPDFFGNGSTRDLRGRFN
jgi:hypothetical protein